MTDKGRSWLRCPSEVHCSCGLHWYQTFYQDGGCKVLLCGHKFDTPVLEWRNKHGQQKLEAILVIRKRFTSKEVRKLLGDDGFQSLKESEAVTNEQ